MTDSSRPENGLDPEVEVVEAVFAEELNLPDDPNQAIRYLTEELAAARADAEQSDDRWKRSVAEFENFRRRRARAEEASVARASERVIYRILPVLDGLDVALAIDESGSEDGVESPSAHPLHQGLSGTRELLLSALADEGLKPIDAVGSSFDPARHEAVQIAEGSGTMVVAAELRRGYLLKGRVIRPTLVVVGYEPSPLTEPDHTDQDPT